jgi:hypothetical protein
MLRFQALALAALGVAATARAAVPQLVPVEGVLNDGSGPVSGDVSLHFAIYDSALGGTPLWLEDQTVNVQSGAFVAYLGLVEPLTLDLFRDSPALWLGVRVEADSEMPRAFLATTPYAAVAEYVTNVPAHTHPPGAGPSGTPNRVVRFVTADTLGDSTIADVSGSVGVGTDAPSERLEVAGNLRLGGAVPSFRVTNVAAPIADSDVATKGFVLAQTAQRSYTILYVSTASHNGSLGGRTGADAACAAEMPAGLTCQNIHAFISVSTADEIREMPNNYGYDRIAPVFWFNPDGGILTRVGEDWGDLLDSAILHSAQQGTGTTTTFRTGSYSDGRAGTSSGTCVGFTSADGTTYDRWGDEDLTDAGWLSSTDTTTCAYARRLVCACTP